MATPTPTPEAPTGLGLREIAPEDVYASFTRTTYGVGDLIPDAELPDPRSRFDRTFAVDAAAGTVEIVTRELLPDAPSRLIDANGRLFTWEANALQVAQDGDAVIFEYFDSAGDWLGRYVVLDPSLEEVASFELPSRDWRIKLFDFDGGYVLARDGDNFRVVDLAVGTSVRLSPHADAAHAFPPSVRSHHPPSSFRDAELLETTDGFALLLPGAVGYRSRLLRYRWPDELLSDVSFDYVTAFEFRDGRAGNVSETGYKLSPDGRYIAVTSLLWGRESGSVETALTTVSVLDAGTGEELMRIGGAVFPVRYLGIGVAVENPGVWLADSSGLVVNTFIGLQIATLDGEWLPVPQHLSRGRLLPSPDDPTLFLHDEGTVVDLEGEMRVSVTGDASEYPGLYGDRDSTWWRGTWGETSRELRLRSWPTVGRGYVPVWTVMYPAIQPPPFEPSVSAELVVDGCLHLESEPTAEPPVTVCLAAGSAVEVVPDAFRRHLVFADDDACGDDIAPYSCVWVHVLTEDGSRGWVQARFLRWSGVPVPDAPAETSRAPFV
ncbi:MAG: hypothetical protein F4X26_00130 [Chloroflexi bacterium]|nr:hypothetical protein [Chloroflexota bacterium]